MKSKFNNQKGFTLAELLIIVAITIIITTVMLANFKVGEKSKRVQLSADAVTNYGRLAQSYAFSGKQIPSGLGAVSGTRCPADSSADFFWLDFDTASRNIDIMAQDGCGATFRMDRYTLPSQVRYLTSNPITLTTCVGSTCTSSYPTSIDVRFVPPFARMQAITTAAPVNFSAVTIVLESDGSERTKTITIDGVSGEIGY